jgi:hypothetical protein
LVSGSSFRCNFIEIPLGERPSFLFFEDAEFRGGFMDWKRILTYLSGSINEALLSHIEYLVAENRIFRGQIKGRLLLTDAERITLA